jgi:hypothetical protein
MCNCWSSLLNCAIEASGSGFSTGKNSDPDSDGHYKGLPSSGAHHRWIVRLSHGGKGFVVDYDAVLAPKEIHWLRVYEHLKHYESKNKQSWPQGS